MTTLTFVEAAIAGWIVVASAVLVFMTRRGHSPTRWAAIAFVLGPFSVLFAAWTRHRSPRIRSTTLQWGAQGPGPLSVLVGIDGSGAAHRALGAAIETLGDRIGHLTLAYVLDFEAAAKHRESPARTEARRVLDAEATAIGERLAVQPRTVLLAGSPAAALVDHAREAGDDLLVIGTHGRGEADWLQGSVAADLAEQRAVRVLIFGGGGTVKPDDPAS
ncbi:MAG: universal stress protein [Acidimicrobiia bacterium]|nr:universal stress protein [Acidimicrobiia bacterium]